jgi:hypothetical protein
LEGDLKALIIEGEPDQCSLDDAWLTIYSDYCNLRGGVQILALIQRCKAIAVLSSKIDRVSVLVQAARRVVSDELIAAIGAEGYRLEAARMKSADDADYIKAVDAVAAKLKSDKLRLEQMLADRDKPKKGVPVEDQRKEESEHFTDEIVAVEEMLKIAIDEDRTTVEKYCGYIRRLQKQIAHIEKVNSHGRRTGK